MKRPFKGEPVENKPFNLLSFCKGLERFSMKNLSIPANTLRTASK